MISSFKLKFGRAVGMTGVTVSTTPVTVFVGPNNSGKSKVLSEIEGYCRTGHKNGAALLLEEVTFSGLSEDRAQQAIEHIQQQPNPGESVQVDHIFVGSRYGRHQLNYKNLLSAVQNPSSNTPG